MANVAITDEADEALEKFIEEQTHGATKKGVVSNWIMEESS